MWTRRELKEAAKQRFRMNYRKCVLVALLLALLGGGAGIGSGGSYSGIRDAYTGNGLFNNHHSLYGFGGSDNGREDDAEDGWEDAEDGWEDDAEDNWEDDAEDSWGDAEDSWGDETGDYDVDLDTIFDGGAKNPAAAVAATAAVAAVVVLVILIVTVVVLVIVIPFSIFLVNPLEVGIKRFFVQNLKADANLREICYAFDHNYMNCVKILFFRDLYVFLWTLLFIIPGIIKAYEYRMVPYIIGENPQISKEEAFAQSDILMRGNKWNTLVLDLSFLGWYILNGMTLGILGIFYVNPYVNQTNAALYKKLKAMRIEEKQPINTDYYV